MRRSQTLSLSDSCLPPDQGLAPQTVQKKLAAKPHIAKAFIPNFAVGCRRLTPGPGYLEALVEPNVDFISTGIKRITETGIETVDGQHREYDTIVCATGCVHSFSRARVAGLHG